MNQRLCHDTAFWMAMVITGLMENFVREEEKKDVFDAVYEVAKEGINRHEIALERQWKRLNPSENYP